MWHRIIKNVVSFGHPFLLAVYPVLFLFAHNIQTVLFGQVARALMVSLLAALVLLALFSTLFRDVTRGAFLASVSVVLFFTYGHVHRAVDVRFPLEWNVYGWHGVLLPLWAVLWTVGALVAARRAISERLRPVNRYLSVVGGLLVGVSLFNVGVYEVSRRPHYDPDWLEGIEAAEAGARPPEQPPDIYYIILDEYSRDDILRDVYGYDNSPFIEYLRGRGFYVASESRTNYPYTFLSLTSSLNMQYLDGLAEGVGVTSDDSTVVDEPIDNSQVARFLGEMGYRFVHVSSGFGETARNRFADEEIYARSGLTKFEWEVGFSTWLQPGMFLWFYQQNRAQMLSRFDAVSRVPEMDGPTFVLAHFILPHGPFIFRTEDGPEPPGGVSVDGVILDEAVYAEHAPYLEQVGFANRKVRELVDGILAASEVPPIIVIQGDHGKRLSPGGEAWGREEYDALVMPILNVYYLPGDGREGLYPAITPVNSFRVILDEYFGTSLGLLEDRTYYSDWATPYDVVELPSD